MKRRLHLSRVIWLVTGLILCAVPALAQPVIDPLEEERNRDALEARTNQLGTFTEAGGTPDPGPAQARGGPCFDIDRILVDGVTIFPASMISAITARYVPNCMQGADIQAVMRELDTLYANAGYITSKTYIPAQNLQNGELLLSMLEGRVEDVFLIDDKQQVETPRGARQLRFAFPNAKDGLFQLRDYEQGLDQMNRLSSVEAVLQLQPGQNPGGSFVIVQRLQNDPVRGYARLDNQGSASTGRTTLSLDLEVDDFLGANDTWRLGYSGTENTNALSLVGSIPYGYWTFETSYGYSEFLSPLDTLTELFGRSRSSSITARVVTARDQFTKTEWSFTLGKRRNERFINDVALAEQKVRYASAGITHLRLGERARNSYDARLTFGTALIGGERPDSSGDSSVPDADFLILEGGWQRQATLGKAGTLVTDLRAQVSGQTLLGNEQISFGSFSTVRGYDRAVASGDTGAYIRNDLYLNNDVWAGLLPATDWAQNFAQNAQPHLLFDAGWVRDRATGDEVTAASVGIGLSYYTDRFTLAAIYGVPLVSNNGFPSGEGVFQVRLDLKGF